MRTSIIVILLLMNCFTGISQDKLNTLNQTFQKLNTLENITYFEVTKNMFESLTKAYGEEQQVKDYISKLHNIKLIQPTGDDKAETGKTIYNTLMLQTDLNDFTLLMTNNDKNSKLSFFKKEDKAKNEYILVSTNMVMYVSGTIELSSLSELDGIIEMAGEAVGM
jgi:hypothetical protein